MEISETRMSNIWNYDFVFLFIRRFRFLVLTLWSVFIDLMANKRSWQDSHNMYFSFSDRGYFSSAAVYLKGTNNLFVMSELQSHWRPCKKFAFEFLPPRCFPSKVRCPFLCLALSFSLTISSCWRCHASASPCKVWDRWNPALSERPSHRPPPSPWIMQSYRLCQLSAGRRGGSQLDIQLLKLTGCPHFETNCWQTAPTWTDRTWMCSYEMSAAVSVWR